MFKNKKLNVAIVLTIAISMIFGAFAMSYGNEYKDKLKAAKEAGKKAAAATKNYKDAAAKLDQIVKDIETTKANIKKSKKDIEKKEKKIDEQEGDLNERLTAMYKTGTVGYVDVILSSEDITDLISNLGMVQKILESDQNLLRKLEKQLKKLEKMKKKLEQQEIDLEAKEEETKELKKKFQKEADEWKAKEEALNAEADALAAQAAGSSGAAADTIRAHGGSTPGYYWPTSTHYISDDYGWRICPFHGKEFHNGLDIAGRSGDPIYSTNAGVVYLASWNGGYGNCIIINMEHYTALYGHLKSISVKSGQYVKAGQLIGYMGSTGNSTGPHLHFTMYLAGTETSINPHSVIGY